MTTPPGSPYPEFFIREGWSTHLGPLCTPPPDHDMCLEQQASDIPETSSYGPIRRRKFTRINPKNGLFYIPENLFRRFYPPGTMVRLKKSKDFTHCQITQVLENQRAELLIKGNVKEVVPFKSISSPLFESGDRVLVCDDKTPRYYEAIVESIHRLVTYVLLTEFNNKRVGIQQTPDYLVRIFPIWNGDDLHDLPREEVPLEVEDHSIQHGLAYHIEGIRYTKLKRNVARIHPYQLTRQTPEFHIPTEVFQRFYPIGAVVRFGGDKVAKTKYQVQGFPEDQKVEICHSNQTLTLPFTSVLLPEFVQNQRVLILGQGNGYSRYYEATFIEANGTNFTVRLTDFNQQVVCFSLNRKDNLVLIFPVRGSGGLDGLQKEEVLLQMGVRGVAYSIQGIEYAHKAPFQLKFLSGQVDDSSQVDDERQYVKHQEILPAKFEISDSLFARFYPLGSDIIYEQSPHCVVRMYEAGKVGIGSCDGSSKIVPLDSIKPPEFKTGDSVLVLDQGDPFLRYFEATVTCSTKNVVWVSRNSDQEFFSIPLNRKDILALIFPVKNSRADSSGCFSMVEGVTRVKSLFHIPMDVFKIFYPVGSTVKFTVDKNQNLYQIVDFPGDQTVKIQRPRDETTVSLSALTPERLSIGKRVLVLDPLDPPRYYEGSVSSVAASKVSILLKEFDGATISLGLNRKDNLAAIFPINDDQVLTQLQTGEVFKKMPSGSLVRGTAYFIEGITYVPGRPPLSLIKSISASSERVS